MAAQTPKSQERSPEAVWSKLALYQDTAYDLEVDRRLDELDALAAEVERYESYAGNIPSEVAIQQSRLEELRPKLEQGRLRLSAMRGDFLPHEPESQVGIQDRGPPRYRRLLEAAVQYKTMHGRGWRKKLADDEGCSESNIKRLLAEGRRLPSAATGKGSKSTGGK